MGQPTTRALRRMSKRLRKKTHRGEFAEWGRRLVVTRSRKEGGEAFMDAFILEAIEANGCHCGGLSLDDRVDVVVELGRLTEGVDARFARVTGWLDGRSDVAGYRAGPLFDLWYGEDERLEGESSAP